MRDGQSGGAWTVILALLVAVVAPLPANAEEIAMPGASYQPAASSSSASYGYLPGGGGEEVYRIGANDVLEITVWQSPDLNKTLTVRFDGRITFPLAGEIVAAGLTPQELAAEISEHLREYIRNPQVNVVIKEFQSRQVLILGKIGRSGIYPLRGPMKILELLTAAGLDLAATDLRNITVMRTSGEVLKIDLEALLYRHDIRQNIDLRAGDNIFLPEKQSVALSGPQTKELMVLGEVTKPGVYSYPADRTVTVKEILLSSGGATPGAQLQGAKIIRANKIQEPVDLNKLIFSADMSQDLTLHAGDVFFVPRRKQIKIYALGMVTRPGAIEGLSNNTDLMQAMTVIGPFRYGAVLSSVKIVRGWPNNPKVISANVEALIHRGRLEENIPLQDGDVIYVPETFLSSATEFLARVFAPIANSVTFAETVTDADINNNNNN